MAKQAKEQPTNEALEKPDIQILDIGQALKLTPGSTSSVGYELGYLQTADTLLIRLTGSDSGGLCSKAWFELQRVIDLLDQQAPDKPFNSSMFKVLWDYKGSSNNAGFLAAVLRKLDLLQPAPELRFAHLITGKHNAWFQQLKPTVSDHA